MKQSPPKPALSLSNINEKTTGKELTPVFSNRDVLIISNANGTQKHKRTIELYIKKCRPIVIGVNLVDKIDEGSGSESNGLKHVR